MAAATASRSHEESLVEQFSAITGAAEDVGRRMLEACSGNLEMAIGTYLESQTDSERMDCASSDLVESRSRPNTLQPVHNMQNHQGSSDFMPSDDNVRAPIPQKREVLVDAPYNHIPDRRRGRRTGSVFDRFRDFQAEAKAQEEMLRSQAKGQTTTKRRTLEDLFRPPLDLMHKGTFETAREAGQRQGRWLLVNVQNVQEFSCQQLNRDVWSNPAVKAIIQQHFIFWQVYHDSDEGTRYSQFYNVTQFPYIAVIDPRTGENMLIWNKLDNTMFCDQVTEFLTDHPSLAREGSKSPPRKRHKRESLIDAGEDSQLEAAIAASLLETSTTVAAKAGGGEEQPLQKSHQSRQGHWDDQDMNTDRDSDTCYSVSSGGGSEPESEGGRDSPLLLPTPKKARKSPPANQTTRPQDAAAGQGSSYPATHPLKDNGTGQPPAVQVAAPAQGNHSNHHAGQANSQGGATSHSRVSQELSGLLASQSGPKANLVLRLPDGQRKQVSLPAVARLKHLAQLLVENGYPRDKYEMVTNFPRKELSNMNQELTMQEAGLYPAESVFVQECRYSD